MRAQVLWSPYTPEAVAAEQAQQRERGEACEGAADDDAAAAQQAAQDELRRLRSDPRCALTVQCPFVGGPSSSIPSCARMSRL